MNRAPQVSNARIIFLHHSTGEIIWNGGTPKLSSRIIKKLNSVLGWNIPKRALLSSLLAQHNARFGTRHSLEEQTFPKARPYGWRNYPFDYYNIWVKHAGPKPFLEEPTLEMLTPKYDVVVFKHCFPVSNIQPENGPSDLNGEYRSLANYKRQYLALREKFHQFPATKFIVWTGAAQVKLRTSEAEAKRTREFVEWVINEWDLPDDNIFVWDFFQLQTEGQLYFQPKFAFSEENSHPNAVFSNSAARLFFQRLVDVVESNGSNTSLTGSSKVA
jgi:hypothetical protein